MNATRYGAFNALVDIIAAPAKAFDEIRAHPRWLWWPLSITVILTIAVFAYYFLWVDFEWLVDDVVRMTVKPGADPATAEAIRSFMSPMVQIASTAVGVLLGTLVFYTIQAVYLHLVNKVVGDPTLGFGQWFSFTAWTSFPTVFNALAMLVVILMAADNQLSQQDLMPLSFQSLFVHAEPGSPWATWAGSMSLVSIWVIALATYGFSRWTGSSIAKSAMVMLVPYVLVYGIWAAVIA